MGAVGARSARELLKRFGQYMDGFSACFSRAPQRTAAALKHTGRGGAAPKSINEIEEDAWDEF